MMMSNREASCLIAADHLFWAMCLLNSKTMETPASIVSINDENYDRIIKEACLDSVLIKIVTKNVDIKIPPVHKTWLVSSVIVHELKKPSRNILSLSEFLSIKNGAEADEMTSLISSQEKLIEMKRVLETLLRYPEHVIWSHLIYDTVLLGFLNEILLYARRPYDLFNDVMFEALSSKSYDASFPNDFKADALFFFARDNQLISELIQMSILLLARPSNRFNDFLFFKHYFEWLFLDRNGIFRALCSFAFSEELQPLLQKLCGPMLVLWSPLVESLLCQLSSDLVALTSFFSLNKKAKDALKNVCQIIDHSATLLGLCKILRNSTNASLKGSLQNHLCLASHNFLLNNPTPYDLDSSSAIPFSPRNQKVEGCGNDTSVSQALNLLLKEMQHIYLECLKTTFSLQSLHLGRMRARRIIIVSIFELFSLPLAWQLSSQSDRCLFIRVVYEWFQSLFVVCEKTGKEYVIQDDFQKCNLTASWVKLLENNKWFDALEQRDMDSFTARFFNKLKTSKALIIHEPSESFKALQNLHGPKEETAQMTVEEEKAVIKIQSLLERGEEFYKDRILFYLRSCHMDLDMTVEKLLDERNVPERDITENVEFKQMTDPGVEPPDKQLKEITVNLAKEQYYESVRSAMRKGLHIVMDTQFRASLPEKCQWSNDQCHEDASTGHPDFKQIPSECLEDDEPEEEFIQLFSPVVNSSEIEHLKESASDTDETKDGRNGSSSFSSKTTYVHSRTRPKTQHYRAREGRQRKMNKGMLPTF